MTDVLEMLIEALQSAQQRRQDDVMVRDIRADARRSPAAQPSSALGQVPEVEVNRPKGWVDALPLGPPPGVRVCDQLMDHQDRLDRAASRAKRGAK